MANETQMKNLTIAGVNFEAPFKYAAGHVLTESEARALNQTRFENLRNNFASKVKASVEGADGAIPQADLPKAFAEFEAAYDFSMPGAGGGTARLDPVEKEALAIAREVVRAKLAKAGKSYNPPKGASPEEAEAYKAQIAAAVERVAASDTVVATAKKNVASRSKALETISDGLDL